MKQEMIMPDRKYQQKKSQHSKELIIDTALRLFREQGIDNVGVREISAEIGMTTGTIYYHFKSKEDLINEFYNGMDDELGETLEKLLSSESAVEAIIRFFADTMGDHIEHEGVDFTAHRMLRMKRTTNEDRKLIRGVEKLVARAQENGELVPSPAADEIRRYVFLVFRGVMYDWCVHEGEFDIHKKMEECITYALKAFAKG